MTGKNGKEEKNTSQTKVWHGNQKTELFYDNSSNITPQLPDDKARRFLYHTA